MSTSTEKSVLIVGIDSLLSLATDVVTDIRQDPRILFWGTREMKAGERIPETIEVCVLNRGLSHSHRALVIDFERLVEKSNRKFKRSIKLKTVADTGAMLEWYASFSKLSENSSVPESVLAPRFVVILGGDSEPEGYEGLGNVKGLVIPASEVCNREVLLGSCHAIVILGQEVDEATITQVRGIATRNNIPFYLAGNGWGIQWFLSQTFGETIEEAAVEVIEPVVAGPQADAVLLPAEPPTSEVKDAPGAPETFPTEQDVRREKFKTATSVAELMDKLGVKNRRELMDTCLAYGHMDLLRELVGKN